MLNVGNSGYYVIICGYSLLSGAIELIISLIKSY